MESTKVSKKALQSLLTDSMQVAIGNLELPKPSKKVKKLLDRSAKKLASEFVHILRKESRKAKKEEREAFVSDVLKQKKSKKVKKSKLEVVEAV
jgi:hypothetical protein